MQRSSGLCEVWLGESPVRTKFEVVAMGGRAPAIDLQVFRGEWLIVSG